MLISAPFFVTPINLTAKRYTFTYQFL
jgi:hypothetical protein